VLASHSKLAGESAGATRPHPSPTLLTTHAALPRLPGPRARLVRVHPPRARHHLGVPGLAAARARLARLRDAQRRHCAPRGTAPVSAVPPLYFLPILNADAQEAWDASAALLQHTAPAKHTALLCHACKCMYSRPWSSRCAPVVRCSHTWAAGVAVAHDGGGRAVQVGVHVQVVRAQVALDQQLVLLRVAAAHHQVAARADSGFYCMNSCPELLLSLRRSGGGPWRYETNAAPTSQAMTRA